MRKLIVLSCIGLISAISAEAQTTRRQRTPRRTSTNVTRNLPAATTTQTISDNDYSRGLKEALSNGVSSAIRSLGREDGFYKNVRVKIPIPKNLRPVEKTLRTIGQGKLVDDFELAINRAAEKAVPEALDIFADSIRQMSFDDVRRIVSGSEKDAATQFFRRTSEERLREKFLPIVTEFTEKTGATAQYKRVISKAGFLAALGGGNNADLDSYVTEKALDGLFTLIADEEKRIRENPIARTSDILQKIFGIGRR